MLLFIVRLKVVLSNWEVSKSVIIQMKLLELYFPVVLFDVTYKVVVAFESVSAIPKSQH